MSDLVGDARAWSPDAQEAARLLAVSALVEGRDRVEAAAQFKVSVKAVDNWWASRPAAGTHCSPAREAAAWVSIRSCLRPS
ncbi:helix-turn-helix domain-containing protein, partial [Streptomyces sp. NPDC058701]